MHKLILFFALVLIITGFYYDSKNLSFSPNEDTSQVNSCSEATFCFRDYKGESWGGAGQIQSHPTEQKAKDEAEKKCAEDKKIKIAEVESCVTQAELSCKRKSSTSVECTPETKDNIMNEIDCKVIHCSNKERDSDGSGYKIKCYTYDLQRNRIEVACTDPKRIDLDYGPFNDGWRCNTAKGTYQKIVRCEEKSKPSDQNPPGRLS